MTGIAMKATLLAAMLTLGMQANAKKPTAEECAAGAIIGGTIGGIFGAGVSNGDPGSTAIGVGTGALLGCAATQDGVDVDVNVNGGYNGGHNGGWNGPGHGGGWNDEDDQVSPRLIERAFYASFDKGVGRTTTVSSRRETVTVKTSNETWGPRGKICRDFRMWTENKWGDQDFDRGTVCLSRRGELTVRYR